MRNGQKVRDYLFEEKIGEGGMGEVWRARHTVLRRQVAIKVMARHLEANPGFGERFLQEAQAQARLSHPRIVGVSDFFEEAGQCFLVMPLMSGKTLADRLHETQGALPVSEALAVARDVLDALDYAHQQGVIHRDVKPSNILLDRGGHACLTDFGIALSLGGRRFTQTGTLLGTPHYMSPEQIRTPRSVDHRTDVYSFGCVLYEMLAGRPPFAAAAEADDTDFALKEAHVYQVPEPIRKWNPTVPARIDAVILSALAKDPGQRWGGCGEFLRALETHGGDIPFEGPQPAPHDKGKSRLFWLLSSVFGCLTLGVLIAVLVTMNDRASDKEEPNRAQQPTDAATPAPPSQTPDQPTPIPSLSLPKRKVKGANPHSKQIISPSIKPSFDCLKASNKVERLVCSSPELAVLDLAMANAYRDLVAERKSPGERKQLRGAQNHWLRQVRDRCPDIACLASTYESRIEELRSARRYHP
jgi:serine/threonine-protein kinase